MSHKFTGVKVVLIDLNGTLYIDSTPIPGSHRALESLRKSGLGIQFVTNNSKESSISTQTRLDKLGFSIHSDEIFSSLTATRHLVERKKARPYLMMSEDAKLDFSTIDCTDPNIVVVGLPPDDLSYADLNNAFQLLMKGAELVAINKARFYKTKGSLSIAAGAIVAALEYSTDKESLVVGKPSKNFFHSAAASLGVEPEHCVMIGDDFNDDITGAIDAGMRGILLKTGKYQKGDEEKVDRPEHLFDVAENIEAAIALVLNDKIM